MNIEQTTIKLRRMVGALHRGFHYEGLSEDIFRAKLDRANALMKRLRPHAEMKQHRQRMAKVQRFMGYRRAELANGAIPTVVLHVVDESYEAFRDGLAVSKIGKDDIVIVSNMVTLQKRGFKNVGKIVDLNHLATMLYGESMPLEKLARKLQVDIGPNRYEAVKTVGLKLIMDFDQILADAKA